MKRRTRQPRQPHTASRPICRGGWRAFLAACCLAAPAVGQALNVLPKEAEGVDVVDRLGERVPRPLTLRTAEGRVVDIDSYFQDGKPAILALVYYDCPLICPEILGRLARSMNALDYTVGRDFNLIVVSIDPTNNDTQALEAKARAYDAYERRKDDVVNRGFAFHTAGEGVSSRLADAVGFKYKLLPNGEYSHPSVWIILSPDGTVSRYLTGLPDPKVDIGRELKMALLEASDGKIAKSLGDMFLHRCFAYDPSTGTYTLQAMRVMQIGGALTVVVLGGFIGLLFLRDRVRRRRRESTPSLVAPLTGQTT